MFAFGSEPDLELADTFANDAVQHVGVGDESWMPYAAELVRLYDLREEHTHEWWTTPRGSIERADYDAFNARYVEALNMWGKALRLVRNNNAQGNFIDFQTAYDALQLRAMEQQFVE